MGGEKSAGQYLVKLVFYIFLFENYYMYEYLPILSPRNYSYLLEEGNNMGYH